MKFKLIMAFVDEDKTQSLMAASRAAGATGATVIKNARGQGLAKPLGIFGFEIMSPRDVVLILVESRRADKVLTAVLEAGKLDETLDTGLALMIDVEQAVGLTEHIKKLAEVNPPD
ncbi:nitrogen regulatory protein PII [Methylophaga lonarensis MPL]|uniref:Nitrogen regulatory protein PII n=1 Tax=Methylophaga lonarensis MPL TaxID=1286106 RepID=M7PHC7_9GAMM|nr:P-II family nitrogen regulator [Methylophaga lonarensis]EMR13270.1 nitrogen regulatory protein PII [Methylophaga lonarensis MPL]